jgi:hypothetical protein
LLEEKGHAGKKDASIVNRISAGLVIDQDVFKVEILDLGRVVRMFSPGSKDPGLEFWS